MAKVDEISRFVVRCVLRDLQGRSGFDSWWYGIDPDIQDEVKDTLADEVAAALEVETKGFTATSGQHVQGWVV